jgi:hypothetical protein
MRHEISEALLSLSQEFYFLVEMQSVVSAGIFKTVIKSVKFLKRLHYRMMHKFQAPGNWATKFCTLNFKLLAWFNVFNYLPLGNYP